MVLIPPDVQTMRFEGYGPQGAVVLIECLTADPGRTREQLRRVFRAHEGFLAAEGAVSYLYDRVGWLRFAPGTDRAPLAEVAYAAGAEDVAGTSLEGLEVRTDPEEFEAIRRALARRGWVPVAAGVSERATLTVPLAGAAACRWRELLQALAEVDGVRHVYSNVEISDALLAGV